MNFKNIHSLSENKPFIQIGANEGGDTFSDICKTLKPMSVVLIEPLLECHDALKSCYKNVPYPVFYEAVAVVDNENIKTINMYSNSGCSAHATITPLADCSTDRNSVKATVPATTIKSIFNKYNISDIGLLYIDTEGNDARILNSIDFTSINIDVIVFEAWHFTQDCFTDQHELNGDAGMKFIINKLKQMNYKVQMIDNGANYLAYKRGNTLFAKMMSRSRNYQQKKSQEKWDKLDSVYGHSLAFDTDDHRIPKIIHQIWLGSPVPDSLRACMQTIRDTNPDYEYKLWTDVDVAQFNFKNKELFNSCKNYGQKSDILRYAILEKIGGIYLDTDFIGHKSFDDLLYLDFFVGVSYDEEPTMFNGLIGSTPNNSIIEKLNDIKEVRDGDGMEVIKSTGPWYLTDIVYDNIESVERIAVMPLEYFYPYPNFGHDKTLGDDYTKYITDKTICVHLWHSRWN